MSSTANVNAQQSISNDVKAPSRSVLQLADASVASFVPASDDAVQQNRIVHYNLTTTAAPRTLTLVDADIDAALGAPAIGSFQTFTIINRGASTVTVTVGGGGQVAAGQGTMAVLTATSARFNLQKVSATAPKWLCDRLYTTTYA